VFFFQAEDGIRDWSVTGVQTCALPISPDRERRDDRLRDPISERIEVHAAAPRGDARLHCQLPGMRRGEPADEGLRECQYLGGIRSEERRVGKEGRWRGAR